MKLFKIVVLLGAVICLVSLYADQKDEIKKEDIVMNTQKESGLQVLASKIQLFMYEDCFYCVKVRLFLEKYNLLEKVEFIDAAIPANKELLKSISGRTQAPYLVDKDANVSMPESEDIMKYLAKKFNIADSQETRKPLSNFDNGEKQHDADTFLSDVCKASKPVVILVSTTWCPPCKVFKPIFVEIAKEFADQFEFILVDGDANRKIVDQLGVRGYPTVVFYKDGKRIELQYSRSKIGFTQAIQKLL